MPKIQDNIVVNASGGAQVNLTATMCARKVVIEEDPTNGANQGIVYQLGSENFAVNHNLAPGEQLVLGNTVAHGKAMGGIQGFPAQNTPGGVAIAASVYAKVISNTASATAVRMTETE